jgi:hypothetical protein
VTESTDWIKPGEKVVTYTYGGVSRSENPSVTLIAKVAAKSFTLENDSLRYSIDRQESPRQGGTWGWTRKVVPFDSDKAREVLEREKHERRMSRARATVDAWERMRTRENRLAAIAALQAVEQDDE